MTFPSGYGLISFNPRPHAEGDRISFMPLRCKGLGRLICESISVAFFLRE